MLYCVICTWYALTFSIFFLCQVVGEVAGLTASLSAERARTLRLLKRQRGLEIEVKKLTMEKHDASLVLKAELEKKVSDLHVELMNERKAVSEASITIEDLRKKDEELAKLLDVERAAVVELEGKLSTVSNTVVDMTRKVAEYQEKNEDLERVLAGVPSTDAVISDFKMSETYKQEIITARVAGVAAYKASEEFDEVVGDAVARAICEFKASEEYTAALERVENESIEKYRKSVAFRQAVGMEAGRMSKQVVECCREFLKDDMQRPVTEFGGFFASYMRQGRVHEAGGSSSLSSAARSNV